jgi:hypothetical protein
MLTGVVKMYGVRMWSGFAWLRMASSSMQLVVTACCIATGKLAELFRFSSAGRSGGWGVVGGGAVVGTWSDAFTAPYICACAVISFEI